MHIILPKMYDRYTITLENDKLAITLGVEASEEYIPQFNAAPTKKLPIVTSIRNKELTFSFWGLMSKWANNKTMSPKFFNLPVDSLRNKVAYRKQLKTHRCIIPMDGFFIWKQIARKHQIPYYFYFPDRQLFSVAGLWEEGEEEGIASFIMVTKPSSNVLIDFQNDMPVMLNVLSAGRWLEADDSITVEDFLQDESSTELIYHTVTPEIKHIEKNHTSLINPVPASDQHGNYTLFN